MPTNPIADLAGRLTEPQRRWITMQGAGVKCVKRLAELGLIERYGDGWHILPLGLALRQHLLEQGEGR